MWFWAELLKSQIKSPYLRAGRAGGGGPMTAAKAPATRNVTSEIAYLARA